MRELWADFNTHDGFLRVLLEECDGLGVGAMVTLVDTDNPQPLRVTGRLVRMDQGKGLAYFDPMWETVR